MKDSIQVAANTALGVADCNVWKLVAGIELAVIVILSVKLLLGRREKSEKRKQKDKILKEGDIDFGNVISSSFGSKELYDELKGKCHPDKFADNEELNAKATEIFSLLVKNKYNYSELQKLKQRAVEELGIEV